MTKKIVLFSLNLFFTAFLRSMTMQPDDLKDCLTHITKLPSPHADGISGFHFYDPSMSEAVDVRVPGIRTTVTIEQLSHNPDGLWIYKVGENDRGDFVAYVINNGICHGPRTFFSPRESGEQLGTRLLFDASYKDSTGHSVRLFDGTNPEESATTLVYDIDRRRPITAYPPIEAFNYNEETTAEIAAALARWQTQRLNKPAIWATLRENNLRDFKKWVSQYPEHQQNVLNDAATHEKWDFVEAIIQQNPALAPNALLHAIKHKNTNAVESFWHFIDDNDKDKPLGPGKPTALAAVCMLPTHDEKERTAKEELLEYLINEGTDVNAVDEQWRTALMYAARVGDDKTVAFLIGKDANPNACDRNKKNAAAYAEEVCNLLKRRGSSPTSFDNFTQIKACLSPIYRLGTKEKSTKKQKKATVARSAPENKLITLNNLLVQDAAQAINTALEFFKSLTRADHNDSTEIEKRRYECLKLLIKNAPETSAQQLGTLCKTFMVKNLLTFAKLMEMLLPEPVEDTPYAACARAIIQNIDIPASSTKWEFADRLIQRYKNLELTKVILSKFDIYREHRSHKTLLTSAIERRNPEEVQAVFGAYGDRYSEEDIQCAVNNNLSELLVTTLQTMHPQWSRLYCMLRLGRAYTDSIDMREEFKKHDFNELMNLLIHVITTKDRATFDIMCSRKYHVNLLSTPYGHSIDMHLFLTHPELMQADNPLVIELIKLSNILQANKSKKVFFDLFVENKELLTHAQTRRNNIYALIRKTLFSELKPDEQTSLINFLTQTALNPFWRYPDDETPLTCAIIAQKDALAKLLLSRTKSMKMPPISLTIAPKVTPLCSAFAMGNEELCHELLQREAQWPEVLEYIYQEIRRLLAHNERESAAFFKILSRADKPLFENKTLGDWSEAVKTSVMHYAILQQQTALIEQFRSSNTAISTCIESFDALLTYALEHKDNICLNFLLSPQVVIADKPDMYDPLYAIICNKLWLTAPEKENERKIADKIRSDVNDFGKLTPDLSVKEIALAFALKSTYEKADTPEMIMHSQERLIQFGHLLQRCPPILGDLICATNMVVKANGGYDEGIATKINVHQYNRRTIMKFFFDCGGTTDNIAVDLMTAIEYSLAQKVHDLLKNHPEIITMIQHDTIIQKNGQRLSIPAMIVAAVNKYDSYVIQEDNLRRAAPNNDFEAIKQEAFDIAKLFLAHCPEPLKPFHFTNRDPLTGHEMQTQITAIEVICGDGRSSRTYKEFDDLFIIPVNQPYNGTFILEYCLGRVFTNHCFPSMFTLINYLLNKHGTTLSGEHLHGACRALFNKFNEHVNAGKRFSLSPLPLSQAIQKLIEIVEQRRDIVETPEIRWTRTAFKNATTITQNHYTPRMPRS